MKLKIIFFPLTLVIAFAIFILMIKPQWESLGISKDQLDAITQKRDTLQNGKQNLQRAFNDFDELDESDRQLIMNAIPPYKNNDDFIAEIYKNMQGSGSFLVGTKLTESRDNKINECEENAKLAAQQASLQDEETEQAVEPLQVYCPPQRLVTKSRVEIIGSYQNIKDFVRLIDSQNRLTVPTSTIIERADKANDASVQTNGDMVRGTLDFDFFNKDSDEGVVLSNMVESNDKVLASLLKGSVNVQAIDAFKESITSDVFRPVTVTEMGKTDLFAK